MKDQSSQVVDNKKNWWKFWHHTVFNEYAFLLFLPLWKNGFECPKMEVVSFWWHLVLVHCGSSGILYHSEIWCKLSPLSLPGGSTVVSRCLRSLIAFGIIVYLFVSFYIGPRCLLRLCPRVLAVLAVCNELFAHTRTANSPGSFKSRLRTELFISTGSTRSIGRFRAFRELLIHPPVTVALQRNVCRLDLFILYVAQNTQFIFTVHGSDGQYCLRQSFFLSDHDNSWTAAISSMKFCVTMYVDNIMKSREFQGHRSISFLLVDRSSPNCLHWTWEKS